MICWNLLPSFNSTRKTRAVFPRYEEDSFGEGEMPRWDTAILTCLFWSNLSFCTPLQINGWNLKITQLKGKIIFQTSMTLGSMLISRV